MTTYFFMIQSIYWLSRVQADSVGQRRAVCTHKKSGKRPFAQSLPAPICFKLFISPVRIYVGHRVLRLSPTPLSTTYFVCCSGTLSAFHLAALCAVLSHTLISLFSVRPFVVQSVDRGPFGRCSRSIPSHLGAYLSLIVSGIPLCTNLPITPTVQCRRGSVAFVLALVEFVPFGSCSRSRLQLTKSV